MKGKCNVIILQNQNNKEEFKQFIPVYIEALKNEHSVFVFVWGEGGGAVVGLNYIKRNKYYINNLIISFVIQRKNAILAAVFRLSFSLSNSIRASKR